MPMMQYGMRDWHARAGFNEWVKLEVIGDQETLLPTTEGLLVATRVLAKEGFKVMAYTNDDSSPLCVSRKRAPSQ
jgi:thiazole synthase ThiGH ThiG subunit